MIKPSFNIRLLLPILVILSLSTASMAQPSRDRVLSDLQITEQSGQAVVDIEFNFPVRYIRHFPESQGDELQIQFDPIAVNPNDREALYQREAITGDEDNLADISEVVYEGDSFSGFRVTVYFNHPQTYTVTQGGDYRSIVVTTQVSTVPPAKE